MSAGTSEFFCLICLLVCSCTAQEKITAKLGHNVILPCKVPNINNINDITAVGWIRRGLDPEYVFLYRDGRFDPENQHPSYQNRVDLQDEEMKDGDVSLILNNVKMEDTGTYMCRVSLKGKAEVISTYLEVIKPDHSWKTIVGVVVPLVVIILSAVGFVGYKKLQIWKMKKKLQEQIDRLMGNYSETINQLQQEKQENEILENEMEELKGNNPETSNQLQQEKLKNEILMNKVVELKRSHSDPSNELQQEKRRNELLNSHLRKRAKSDEKLKTGIQNQIQKLDELNFDTNSEPTGSDEKNQQEELEKLQDEKQKWMKTVGNLKTELQNMNQELKLAGTIIVEEVNERDRYIRLRNISSEDIQLESWRLKLHRNDSGADTYTFNESLKLQAGRILTIGWRLWSTDHSDDVYLRWTELQYWNLGDKLEIELFSNKGENFKLRSCE